MLPQAQDCFRRIISAIAQEEPVLLIVPQGEGNIEWLHTNQLPTDGSVVTLEIPTNDTWARDFGPITILDSQQQPNWIDFKFNGWGLKFASHLDNLISQRIKISGKPRLLNRQGFVLEGGSIESDGQGTILTTSECLLSPNRNGHLTKQQIQHQLLNDFNAKQILWLDFGYLKGDDTDSHIDTLARLAPDNTIVYVRTEDPADEHFESLQCMEHQLKSFRTLQGNPYRLMPLPLPHPIYDTEGNRLPATYANFLITPTRILMPTYSQPANDEIARATLATAFPGREIVGIECTPLIQQHGSLHCVTMQLPAVKL